MLLRNFFKLIPPVCKTVLISSALLQAYFSGRQVCMKSSVKSCCKIDVGASERPCMQSYANFWGTIIAPEGEQVAPNMSRLYLNIYPVSSSVQRKCKLSWSCGWMPICMNIGTLARFPQWLLLSTFWSGEEGTADCKEDPALTAMHHWVKLPSILNQRLQPQNSSGFCLIINEWWGRYKQSVCNWGLQWWCSFHPNLFRSFHRSGISRLCPSRSFVLQSVLLKFSHEVIVRECDVLLLWKSNMVSITNVLYGIIEDGHSFFVIWRPFLRSSLIGVHYYNCPEKLEKIFIWILLLYHDMIEKCYVCVVLWSDPLLLRNVSCQCPTKQVVD